MPTAAHTKEMLDSALAIYEKAKERDVDHISRLLVSEF